MGWLAPLYLAGFLAIGLPILLHLIRRTPQGRQRFSSLMFLTPSPPRLTRRSRLSNILLLLLRALAIILLALAFMRPYLMGPSDLDDQRFSGRRIALLVDSSASMQRDDLWRQAGRHVEEVLRDVSPADEVALYAFDRQVSAEFTFARWRQADAPLRKALLLAQFARIQPSWHATRMGQAIATVADQLAETDASTGHQDRITRHLVLVSDMQQGSRIEALQGYEWPEAVRLEVRPVVATTGNASLQRVRGDELQGEVHLRVTNEAGSSREQFTIGWGDRRGALAGDQPLTLYVAPGRSQVVRLPPPQAPAPGAAAPEVDRVLLGGDECDFDNTLFLVPARLDTFRLMFMGDENPQDVNAMRFYLESVLSDASRRRVEITARRPDETVLDADLAGTRLVVVTGNATAESAGRLRRFVEDGGDVLWVMKDASGAESLARLMDVQRLDLREVGASVTPSARSTGDHALIGQVDLAHPLFAPFADPRYGDFTRIHFWKHRRMVVPQGAGVQVLVWFDNGDPFLLEQALGEGGGRLRIMTSGWHPVDSQLALSPKFVPLMEGLSRRKDEVTVGALYAVGESIGLPAPAAGVVARRSVVTPTGNRLELAAQATAFEGADGPGIYQLMIDGAETVVAVNLTAEESRTAPMPAEQLEQFGARLGAPQAGDQTLAAQERRLKAAELENRQKLWQWLIVCVLGLLGAETLLAGRLARRAFTEQASI